MLINKSYKINSCDDVELNIKRESKLEYRLTFDDSKDIKAIVFIIGGFGANANISFLDFDREYLAKNFDVAVVNVFYHCFCARKSIDEKYNPKIVPNEQDLYQIQKLLSNIGLSHIKADEKNYYNLIYPVIEEYIKKLKEERIIAKDIKAYLSCDFIPPNNEYQNYGIMAAIDHINALKDIVKNYPEFTNLPKIYGGGSYGGYLSLLIAKIAPWYVDGVVDNSAITMPHIRHILGRETEIPEFVFTMENVDLNCYVKKYWTRNINSPFYLNDENYIIRSILNSNHLLIQQKLNPNIIYIHYHSAKDIGAPAKDKIELHKIYKNLGFDTTLHLIESEDQIDGKLIKSLEHGLRMTDKALFRQELPIVLEKLKNRKSFMRENSISYPCKEKVFTFKDKEDKFVLEF